MVVICLITIYPIWYVIVNSLNDGMDAMSGGIYWWPRKFSLLSYKAVFQNAGIVKAFRSNSFKNNYRYINSCIFYSNGSLPSI